MSSNPVTVPSPTSAVRSTLNYSAPIQRASPRRVLVIDRSDGAQLGELLTGTDFVVEAAPSTEDAMQVIDNDRSIEVLLVESGGDSFAAVDFVALLRERRPDVAVLVMSTAPDVREAQAALRAGAADYLLKPLRSDDLIPSLERACLSARIVESKRAAAYGLCRILALKDEETKGHCDRVVGYSLRIGTVLGLGERQLFELEMGSLLHDIGKIQVPNSILKKPAKLTADEWVEMRKHPVVGERLLLMCGFSQSAASVAGQHHEQWDGGGYPRFLKGPEIDLLARIFSVADSVDSITSDRVYRARRGFDVAREEIKEFAGSQFDPLVAEAFLSVPDAEWQAVRAEAESRAWPLASVDNCL